MTTRILFSLLLSSVALSVGCANSGRHAESNEAMVERLPARDRTRIDDARAERDRRGDELAAAKQDAVRSRSELEVAKKGLEVAEARVAKAQASVHVAESGSTDELEAARDALTEAQAGLAAPRAEIGWRACDIVRRDEGVHVAGRKHELASAQVDAITARAVGGLDRTSTDSTQLELHEKRVRDCEKELALAQVQFDAAARECTLAEDAYKASAEPSAKG
ncbi:MAG: hypothetical protein IPJ77_02575 [Planctomycetes bacterium]|nr:hypothetical protein [Planctomycetota bacterium]